MHPAMTPAFTSVLGKAFLSETLAPHPIPLKIPSGGQEKRNEAAVYHESPPPEVRCASLNHPQIRPTGPCRSAQSAPDPAANQMTLLGNLGASWAARAVAKLAFKWLNGPSHLQ
ncbi:uncharacterized protein UV8b_01810 [Ustilaginoidea virens]|uniref:Uncharacterized protein n=1 Tax=Ustilaginoidea virens TaxID=1159556 RepID=A0A8E5HLA6_USTVR|nr:uncharacterized protein UV8b_01810 [Ustilaginoidea virens]QUC17569.1 hypothetical protein UV8b_01810 [Ustilaginoidea virens]